VVFERHQHAEIAGRRIDAAEAGDDGISAMPPTLANASPVAAISAAPNSISVRRSCRDAITPTPRVSAAVPSSAAVRMAPIATGS
jgi:hypothetical protein